MKKGLVLIYPLFSMQEITSLTEIFSWNQKEFDVVSFSRDAVLTEDGFKVVPDLSTEEVNLDHYDCVVLPGMALCSEKVLIPQYKQFLSQLKEKEEILIAAISSAPLLLGQAGLLEGRRYCAGLYEEAIDSLPFMPREGLMVGPLVQDSKLITAIGKAYREFAFCVADYFHLNVDKDFFGPLQEDWYHEALRWTMPEEELKQWMDTIKPLLK